MKLSLSLLLTLLTACGNDMFNRETEVIEAPDNNLKLFQTFEPIVVKVFDFGVPNCQPMIGSSNRSKIITNQREYYISPDSDPGFLSQISNISYQPGMSYQGCFITFNASAQITITRGPLVITPPNPTEVDMVIVRSGNIPNL